MPRGDRTGPAGLGPMSGRAAGFCAGYPVPGTMNPAGGRGYWGWGRGFGGHGRGWRNWFHATGLPGWVRAGWTGAPYGYPWPTPNLDPETEKQALNNQAEALQSELDFIKKRLSEIETGPAKE